jgi:tetratricopeptide (TPR) repeat protein
MCHNLWMMGRPTDALAFGRSARAFGESLRDVELQVTGSLYFGVASALFGTGHYRRAEDLLLKVLRLLEGGRSRERLGLAGFPAVLARGYLALVFADQGHFKEGIAQGQESIRLAEALDHPYSLAFGCWTLASLEITRGEFSRAIDLLERGVALSREWTLAYFSLTHSGNLGYAYALSGRVAEGIPLLQHALSAGEAMGFGTIQGLFLAHLGEAYLLDGRLAEALECAGHALILTRERGQRPLQAWALRVLGEVSARSDPPARTEGHYRDALALAAELGMRPLAAHCHLGLGTLYRRAGAEAKAHEHLTTAATMYRGMGMGFWLEKAEVELGPPHENSP